VNEWVEADLQNPRQVEVIQSMRYALRKTVAHENDFENWGEMHRLSLNHYFSRIPVIGRNYRFGDYPVGGSYTSLMKTAHNVTNKKHETYFGAQARFISLLHDPKENYAVLMGGQDGWLKSPQFIDQVPLWLKGEYIRMPYDWLDAQVNFSEIMELLP
jgi:penicillin amidase